jgi:hypothetical protein
MKTGIYEAFLALPRFFGRTFAYLTAEVAVPQQSGRAAGRCNSYR